MTAQIGEKLWYQGEKYEMCSEPLESYFRLAEIKPGFRFNCTALWRGYVGTWEIVDQRLYLVGLRGTLEDGREVSVETFFPGYAERVCAHWFSGSIRIPQGKLIKYIHMGYGSVYERDLILNIERGVVVATEVKHNGTALYPEGPEGYAIGAMTIFPRSPQPDEDS